MTENTVNIYNASAVHPVVLVCEHASAHIPIAFNRLSLDKDASLSHIAWDPGASAVAHHLADGLNAVLVESGVSRLLYDCNRPPESSTAIPVRSEIYAIPGNRNLTEAERNSRVQDFYVPFDSALSEALSNHSCTPVLVTIHSFTPVYHGSKRSVEVGVLHDSDARLADVILSSADAFDVKRNEPYGPDDGVTHTLIRHGLQNQLLNVMIEIRNDIIATAISQKSVAAHLQRWIEAALQTLGVNTTHEPGGTV